MFDLRGANTKCKRTERPVRGGMTVTAHNGCAWEGEALLWADDVDDALPLVAESKVR